MKSFLALCGAVVLILAGCQKKVESVPVGAMSEYKDPAYGFRIQYPQTWKQLGTTGKAVFAKSQDVLNKFVDPTTGEEGAQVSAEVLRLAGGSSDSVIGASKDELKQTWQNIQIGPDESLTVDGKPSVKVPYSIPITAKTAITGYEIYVPGDTAVYRLDFVGFGDQFGAHAAVFDTMLHSFDVPVVVAKKPEFWQPSGNYDTYKSNFFTMEHPDNLEFVDVRKGPKDDLAMEMRADRLDCSIHIDVFGAQKLTVAKVWDQNKGRYAARGQGQTKIDGEDAYWVDYSPRKDIGSRAYFVVKNDKVIRVTINYYAPQKDVYFPVFEKCVSSLKLK